MRSRFPNLLRGRLSSRMAVALCSFLAVTGGSARAANYFVSPGGNDANSGTSIASPWATLAKANATVQAGDACYILPGIYTHGIAPSANGRAGAPIIYVGDVRDPSLVQVASLELNRSFISVKGISTSPGHGAGIAWLDNASKAARSDSISFCLLRGSVDILGAKDCVVYGNTINGPFAMLMDHGYTQGPPSDLGTVSSERNTIRRNVMNLGAITWKGFVCRGYTQHCVIDSNRIAGLFSGANIDIQGRYLYQSYFNVFRDNRWTFEATNAPPGGGAQWVAFALRDSSHDNLFERDSMLCGLSSGFAIGGRLVNAGNAPYVGQCRGNRWNACFYKTTSYSFAQDLFASCTIENSVFASRNDYALWILGDMSGSTIRNNTFYGGSDQPFRVEGDIRLGGNTIANNIFYADSAAGCPYGGIIRHAHTTGFTENNNLFFARKGPSGADRATMAISWSQCSRPGSGGPWAAATGQDAGSRWGSPSFVDSTWATLDLRLRSDSRAIGVGQGGTDAGAYPFVASGPDVTPPAAITDLDTTQVGDQSLILTWSAPGDDGARGTAAGYDLRWSLQPITDQNFASATPMTVQPAPVGAGGAQSYVVTGLSPGTTYHFAIRARDSAGNLAALGTVLQVTTATNDLIAPAAVKDLGTEP